MYKEKEYNNPNFNISGKFGDPQYVPEDETPNPRFVLRGPYREPPIIQSGIGWGEWSTFLLLSSAWTLAMGAYVYMALGNIEVNNLVTSELKDELNKELHPSSAQTSDHDNVVNMFDNKEAV